MDTASSNGNPPVVNKSHSLVLREGKLNETTHEFMNVMLYRISNIFYIL